MTDTATNLRDTVVDSLKRLGDSATADQIRAEINEVLSIVEGQLDIVEGRIHSHAEVMEEARQCLSKYTGRRVPVAI